MLKDLIIRRFSAVFRSRRSSWLVLGLTAIAVALLFAFLPKPASDSYPPSGLPSSAESAKVSALLAAFPSADTTVGIVVYDRGGDDLTAADRTAIAERATALATLSTTPEAVRPQFSDDGSAALVAVPVSSSDDVGTPAADLRTAAAKSLPSGLTAQLTGPVGFQDDVSNSFAGADFRLLLVTVLVVAALLIITYRSPVLWIVPLAVVGTADGLAGVVVKALAEPLGLTVDASISGILSVLVFGAGTNYALLLVARYREELTRTPDRFAAMRTAVTSAGPAIAASGGTVALSLLTLLLATLSTNRALGFACAVGVVVAILFALVALPAALVICGRRLFWPFIPRVADTAPETGDTPRGFWAGLGTRVSHRPVVVSVVAVVGLGVLALGLSGYAVGLSQTAQLLGDPASVTAQKVIDRSFSAGLTSRTTVLAPTSVADDATELAKGTTGVSSAAAGDAHAGRTEISVSLTAEPESDAAFRTIERLRDGYADGDGSLAQTLVGGTDATALDTQNAANHDQDLVIPIILAIVFVVLLLLLRSLVAPILLIASVLATFFASLGASTFLFTHVFGFDALDSSVTLFAFLFLVALGVDYNIFLTTRAREESALHGTRPGMIRALSSTGAVITSAGVLLAAVFAVLGVLPVVALTQVGIIVCIGVLLDTLVVRTVLVPALVFVTGNAFWWPSRPHHGAHMR
ncbi:RND superfamily putative drug exporter [Frondihabitans sp. PhB188]|uniref:MMPL family transporter n=1 Tax=Frondihabitans sp. PhB188 TaxID=2485200 RepID=UPI000FC18ACE|nr:MMPL family transporter [Frondihabitans sp. PhB188]ROQ39454.1 RND superfamily putative drug exporter [Frondihabitans sp. PhB188]